MKRLILAVYLALCSVSLFAAKANTAPITICQPDGTNLTVMLQGDENVNWYSTLDGVILVSKGNGYYVANIDDNGICSPSDVLAHEPLMRSQKEKNIALKQNTEALLSSAKKALARQASPSFIVKDSQSNGKGIRIKDDTTLFPHVGSPKVLVLLVEFTDTVFTLPDPKASFNDYLNNDSGSIVNRGNGENKNYKGARGYFKDMSFGQFTPVFDLVGPVKLNHPLSYYGAGNDRMDRLIPDACKAVDDSVNFADYDANGDGIVDLVYVIYAGHSESEAGNSSIDIWPKSGYGNYGTFDGKRIYRYGVNNELNGSERNKHKYINGLGLFCHEFSHTMGLPDIYATSGSVGYNKDDFGMEFWDLMDGGEYVAGGRYPTAYSSFEREVMGWTSVDTLKDTTHVAMSTIDDADSMAHACKILNDDVDNEAIYLQNIQNKGWNRYLPGHGLLAYRVSYYSNEVNLYDRPNNGSRPRIVVIPADGRLGAMASYSNDKTPVNYYADMAGDTYPGTTGTDSIMSFLAFDGSYIEKPVLNITESESGIIGFDFLGKKENTTYINKVYDDGRTDNRIFSISGQYLGTDVSTLKSGIYIINKKKIIIR